MSSHMDPFAALLKRQRLDHNLGLREVAAALGVGVADVSAWENGRSRPSPVAPVLMGYRVQDSDIMAAAIVLSRLPVLDPPRGVGSLVHVSWAHDPALGYTCGCNECRMEWFNTHACPTCHGDGLRPGAPEKPDDPREVARLNGQAPCPPPEASR